MKRWIRRLPELILGSCLTIAVLRLVFRDRLPILSTLMYATPPIVLAALAAGGALAGFVLKRRRWAIGGGVLTLAFVLWFAGASFFANPAGKEGDLRVLLWNVSRGSRGWSAVAAHVRDVRPDLAVFVEGGRKRPERDEFLRQVLPGTDQRWLDGGLGVAVRGKISGTVSHRLGHGGRAGIVQVETGARRLTVVIVDLWANPWQHRREAFDALQALLEPLNRDSLLVVGDFNTPRDSFFFDRLRGDFSNAFEHAGRGFDGTWPHPVPLLAIDHIWFGSSLKARSCRLEGTGASDHRSVLAEFGP